MRNFLKVFFSVFVMAIIAHCSTTFASDWPTQYPNSQNNPVVFDTFRQNNSAYTINVGASIMTFPPVVGDGKIFYAAGSSTNYTLYAINLADGTELWRKTFPRQILNIVYDNGRIYFGAVNIYSLDANTGAEIWKTNICNTYPNENLCRVMRVEGGKVYGYRFQSNIAKLLIVDENSGTILQNRDDISFNISSTMLIDDNNLYIVNFGNAISIIRVSKADYVKSTPFKVCPLSSGNSILDKENNLLHVASSGRLCSYNLLTGETKINLSSGTYGGFAKYGNTIYSKGNYTLVSFSASEMAPFSKFEKVVGFDPYVGPLVVNGVLYFGSSDGRIWGINLETGATKTWTIENGTAISSLIYSNGQIIASGRVSNIDKFFILDLNNLSLRPNDFTVSLESPYKTDGDYNSYLGQLHAHYVPDFDWSSLYISKAKTPGDVVSKYLEKKYDFAAITEHDALTSNPEIADIMYIENSEEDTNSPSDHHILSIAINNQIDENNSDQNRVNQIVNQGGIAIFSHPNANKYNISLDELNNLQDYNAIEIYNSGVDRWRLFAGEPYSLDKFDALVSSGKKIWAMSGDDYTPWNSGFDGGAVVILSKTKTQADVMQNFKDGNFYALQGSQAPRIGIIASERQITINSDRQSKIKFIGNGGKTLQETNNVFSASYITTGDEIYVRAEVEANGKTAWTQPIKVNKNKVTQSLTSGAHYFDLGQSSLVANTTETANASVLPSPQYPTQSPPLGYLSPVYSFSTTGQVLDGTNLSISYADKSIFTNEDNLAIYAYDEAVSSWKKVASNVDKVNKVVSAVLSHFSLYTLSAEQTEDLEEPTISLISPTDLTNLSNQIDFEASASDNNAVTEMRFSVDDKPVAKDTDMSDGWKAAVDANDFSIGNHKLKLEAEDFFGNIGNFETIFTIADSTFIAPTISLSAPANEQYLKDTFAISGNYSSQNEVKNISVYLNDIYITDADFSNGTFQKEIDFSQIKEGKHVLKIALADIKGNISDVTTTMNVGDELKINIVSPQNKTYLHSESILFQYQTTPADVDGVVAKIDDSEISNNSTRNAYELSLGQHKYSMEKNGKVYAETYFTISTNLADQTKLVEIMYRIGHIRNHGIATAIQARLALAQIFEKLKMKNMRNSMIQDTIKFINQQNKQKKPLIDNCAGEIIIRDLNYLEEN